MNEPQARRSLMLRILDAYGGLGEVVRDLHAYGGLFLAAFGADLLLHGAGYLLAGLGLFGIHLKGRR